MCINCEIKELHFKLQNHKAEFVKTKGVAANSMTNAEYNDIEGDSQALIQELAKRMDQDPELAKMISAIGFQAEKTAIAYVAIVKNSEFKDNIERLIYDAVADATEKQMRSGSSVKNFS